MTKQVETFNLQLDQLFRGEAIADLPELAFARRLRAVDFSPRSQVYHSLRARLFDAEVSHAFSPTAAPAIAPPFRIQHKTHWRISLMSRFTLLKPALAFGVAMVLLVWFLTWALTNTTPQPAIAPSPSPVFSSSPPPVETATEELPVAIPQVSLTGDLFFLIRPTSPPFYYQWAHLPAFCLGDRVDCDLQMLPALPGGETIPDTTLSWSPDGTKAIFFNSHSTTPTLYELSAMTGEWRAIPVDFWVVKDEYFWAFTSQWVAFQAQGEGDHTSYISFFNPETNEFRESNEVPGEERIPVFWLREDELIVQILRYVPNGSGNNPVGRYVLLNVQTGQETEYNGFEAMGVVSPTTTWGSDDVLSPDYLWWASPRSKGLQTEIVLMRGDGSENHSIFKADGRLNGPVIWLNNNYLFVRLYNQQVDRNNLYLISLADNTAQEISLPGLDTSAFDVSQVSFRPNADPPFGGPSAGLSPTPTPYPTHEATTGDPLTVLQTITAKYASDILSGSGWLHLKSRNYTGEESDPLPNGVSIPNPSIFDTWFQLDEQRQIIRAVFLFTDEDGHINQVSIQRDGQSINLTLGEQSPADPFNPNFDLDFAEKAANLVANGQTLRMSDLYFDGQYIGVMFNIQTENGFEWEALFDPDTGQLQNLILYQLISGGKTIQLSTSILVEEWVDIPPADILAYLDQQPAPYAPLPPLGTPAPAGFDASQSDLTFKMIFGDDFNNPSFYYMDVYAEGYLLGRFDSGGVPGGYCDRSWNGVLLAFTYVKDGDSTLRWFSLKDVAMFRDLPGYDLHSPATFAPNDFRLTFVGCKEEDCGIFVKDLETNSAVLKLSDGDAYGRPAWSPDGQYIIIWYGEPINERGITNIKVVHAETGEVLYMGDPTQDGSPLQAWHISPMYRPMASTGRCEAAPDNLPSSAALSLDGTYTVQEGDTLAGIANHFGVAIEILLSFNGLSSDTVLYAGQVLIVFPPLTNP